MIMAHGETNIKKPYGGCFSSMLMDKHDKGFEIFATVL
jgi:hypothetical protein